MSDKQYTTHKVPVRRQQRIVIATVKITLLSIFLGILAIIFTAIPALAAERISMSYNVLDFSLSVSALETYAKTGKINDELAFYTKFLQQQDLATFRQALLYREDVKSAVISEFLYSPAGETALKNIGQIIETESGQNGFYALRAALILAADDPEGLTLLNVMRHYPTDSIRINLEKILRLI